MHTFKLAMGNDFIMFHIIADHALLPDILIDWVYCRIDILNKYTNSENLMALREVIGSRRGRSVLHLSKPYVVQGLSEEDEIILKLKGLTLTRIPCPLRNNIELNSTSTFKRLNIAVDILREYL